MKPQSSVLSPKSSFFTRSIRSRLLVTFVSVTVLGSLALLLVAGTQLQNATLEFYRRDLFTETILIADTLAAQRSEEGEQTEDEVSQQSLRNTFDLVARLPEVHIALYDRHLNVLGSTDANYERPADAPELTEALRGEPIQVTRPDARGEEIVYTAAPISHEEGVYAVIEITAPLAPAYQQVYAHWLQLGGLALPVIAGSLAASLWLGAVLARPIRQLNASALRIGQGALNERIDIRSPDELGQLGAAFNEMAGSLQALMAAQRSFVSNAAHELRAPLMSLKLRVEGMGDVTLSDDQREAYRREAADEVERMSELVTGLLVLARIDEGRHLQDVEPYDGAALFQDVARAWRIQAQAAGLAFEADAPEALPALPLRAADLRMIVDNLLSNAVKYTPTGGKIALRVTNGGGRFSLDVSDTGEGFSPDDAPRLFERFFRADRSRNGAVPGTGLGLSIVESLVAHYGGSVSASSPGVGKGSRFHVEFPLASG